MPEETLFFKDKITLSEDEVIYVEKNPEGLTKEGIQHNLNSWKSGSKNKYVVRRYEVMLNGSKDVDACKTTTLSGKTSDGKTILARNNDGKVTWSEMLDSKLNLIKQEV